MANDTRTATLLEAAEIAAAEANKYKTLWQQSNDGALRVWYDAQARCARTIAEAIRARADASAPSGLEDQQPGVFDPNKAWGRTSEEVWRGRTKIALAERDAAQTELAAMTERCRVLEEALLPFADKADDLGTDESDHDRFRQTFRGSLKPLLTVGDLRRAAKAIRGEA